MPDRELTVDDISGECAEHFMQHLSKYPPQVSSRNAASGWACFVHNEVNAMLDKPEFDCTNLGEFYDCGCGEGDQVGEGKEGSAASRSDSRKEITGQHDGPAVEISKEESVTSCCAALVMAVRLLTCDLGLPAVDGMTFRSFYRLHRAHPVWFVPCAWMLLRYLVTHAYGAGLPCTIINRRLTMSIQPIYPFCVLHVALGIKGCLSRGI